MEPSALSNDKLASILQAVVSVVPGVFCYHDQDQRLCLFNEAYARLFEQLTGRRPHIGERTSGFLLDATLQKNVEDHRRQAQTGSQFTSLYEINVGQETQTWQVHWQPVCAADGTVLGTLAWGQDITEQKREQDFLQMLRPVLAQMQDMVLVTEAWPIDAAEGGPRIVYVNEAFERATGYIRAEVIGKTPRILQGPKTQRDRLDRLRSAFEQWEPVRVELVNYRKDRREFIVDISISPITGASGKVDYWLAIQRDVTKEKALIAILNDALEERSALLQEVHHRVKNNLQTVISLLELHANESDSYALHTLLDQARSRIMAMALIHERLYHQLDFSHVQLNELLASLVHQLQSIFPDLPLQVTLYPSQVTIPLSLAVPVALIAHELLTNAFKHGAAAGAQAILVQLSQAAQVVTLEVIDDGIYHPPDLSDRLNSAKQLGFRLVNLLAKQLNGTITVNPQPGRFCTKLSFPLDEGECKP